MLRISTHLLDGEGHKRGKACGDSIIRKREKKPEESSGQIYPAGREYKTVKKPNWGRKRLKKKKEGGSREKRRTVRFEEIPVKNFTREKGVRRKTENLKRKGKQ